MTHNDLAEAALAIELEATSIRDGQITSRASLGNSVRCDRALVMTQTAGVSMKS
jgi:hypothetical protein